MENNSVLENVDKKFSTKSTNNKKAKKVVKPKNVIRNKNQITLKITINKNSKNPAEKNLFSCLDTLSEDNEMLYYCKLALYSFYPEFMGINSLSKIEKKVKKQRVKRQEPVDMNPLEEPDPLASEDFFSNVAGKSSSDS